VAFLYMNRTQGITIHSFGGRLCWLVLFFNKSDVPLFGAVEHLVVVNYKPVSFYMTFRYGSNTDGGKKC
jgi:hypothetical protein